MTLSTLLLIGRCGPLLVAPLDGKSTPSEPDADVFATVNVDDKSSTTDALTTVELKG